ncbi:MAG TPA: DUF4261 domain-containing protein [Solirubrobacteraceae bacterium]|jgi:hypothetical protein
MIVHRDVPTVTVDGTPVPLLTALTPSDRPQVLEREHEFSQTWGWDGAREAVARATACVTVVEVMGHLHAPADRVTAFRSVVAALAAGTDPIAIWCPNLVKFVPPAHADGLEILVNVRLFRIEDGEEGELVMDSLGLHVLGLPDVQCHFRGVDPGEMAQVLYNLAAHILEHGDVVDDGHTVPGVRGDERWPCRHEAALIGPERVVLAIDPSGGPARRRRAGWRRRG